MAFQTVDKTIRFSHLSTDLPLPSLGNRSGRGAQSLELDTGKLYEWDGTTWYQVDALAGSGSAVLGTVAISSRGFNVATTITRPANQTPYSAGDVLGGALDLGVLGPSAGSVLIRSAQLEADIAAVPAGMTTFTLYLYSVTPPSALADNAAFDLPAGDRASFLGAIPLGTLADLGATLYCEVTDVNKQIKLAGTHLFGYLVTTAAFTPAANSEVYVLSMHTESN